MVFLAMAMVAGGAVALVYAGAWVRREFGSWGALGFSVLSGASVFLLVSVEVVPWSAWPVGMVAMMLAGLVVWPREEQRAS